MRTCYHLRVQATCPVDVSVTDDYKVTVTVRGEKILQVEEILAAVADLTRDPTFQEILTLALACRLGADVRTVGFHSGVRTVCEAP